MSWLGSDASELECAIATTAADWPLAAEPVISATEDAADEGTRRAHRIELLRRAAASGLRSGSPVLVWFAAEAVRVRRETKRADDQLDRAFGEVRAAGDTLEASIADARAVVAPPPTPAPPHAPAPASERKGCLAILGFRGKPLDAESPPPSDASSPPPRIERVADVCAATTAAARDAVVAHAVHVTAAGSHVRSQSARLTEIL